MLRCEIMDTILETINGPEDVKKLTIEQMEQLCEEIRAFLVKSVSVTGGHLASNLGTVELTVALHKIFDLPNDKIIWDVGHQSYTHKLLTGRREQFHTLRKKDGLSGFPRPKESVYDTFMAGHSSTSISAAIGICAANRLEHKNDHVIAVIGDGAFTGGMAYEALNNAGKNIDNLIVILNHNEMSISKNVGGFARYLASIRSRPRYFKMKKRVEKVLDHIPLVGKRLKMTMQSSKSMLKNMLYHSTFFEDFGFVYLGPVDGHDMPKLLNTLEGAKNYHKPVIIHLYTVKGKGYSFAEHNPGAFHGISQFDVDTGLPCSIQETCYSQVAGQVLNELAESNEKICAVTAAMKYGTGLQDFAHAHRDRFYDVGIAEQHAVTFCAGLASRGFIPVFAVYSSFLQRAYDQVIHDAAIEKQHIVLAVDRAGIVGEDGETHQGIFDVSFLTSIPGVTLYSPCGFEELECCLKRAVNQDTGVVAVRYPRGTQNKEIHWPAGFRDHLRLGSGSDVLLVSYGRLSEQVYLAREALRAEQIHVDLLKLTQLSPMSEDVPEICKQYSTVLFYEEGIKNGGIGQQLLLLLHEQGFRGAFHLRAIEDFVPQATVSESLADLKLDAASMISDAKALLADKK
ncbi:MAG: 1-deoxy-D-xylulose-5-phosphate synthase [Clostridiales bacterium]|nr:1-deoxy-D-xylulose-5-phosphate synthase [Clostridiales bacterium]